MDTEAPAPTQTPLRPGEFVARVIPAEEWLRRRAAGEFAYYPTMPDPDYSLLVVVEDHEGKTVASWYALNTVHLEGVYIAPAQRHQASVTSMLIRGMLNALSTGQIPSVLTIAEDASIITLAQKLGFVIVPGTLLQLDLRKGY